MIAKIKVDDIIHKIEIPDGWYRIPKKSNVLIKEGDLSYSPDRGKWIEATAFGYPVAGRYAVIRKKQTKTELDIAYVKVNNEIREVEIPSGWELVPKNGGAVRQGDKFYDIKKKTWINAIPSEYVRKDDVGRKFAVIRKRGDGSTYTATIMDGGKAFEVEIPCGWHIVETGNVLDGDLAHTFGDDVWATPGCGINIRTFRCIIRKSDLTKQQDTTETPKETPALTPEQIVEEAIPFIPAGWNRLTFGYTTEGDLMYTRGLSEKWTEPIPGTNVKALVCVIRKDMVKEIPIKNEYAEIMNKIVQALLLRVQDKPTIPSPIGYVIRNVSDVKDLAHNLKVQAEYKESAQFIVIDIFDHMRKAIENNHTISLFEYILKSGTSKEIKAQIIEELVKRGFTAEVIEPQYAVYGTKIIISGWAQ